jgi:fatty-acid desaturase
VALVALATHYVLHNGEWDNKFHIFLGIWTVAFSGLAVVEYTYDPRTNSIVAATKTSATVATVYFTVLTTSILLHRAFFHRLQDVRKGTRYDKDLCD